MDDNSTETKAPYLKHLRGKFTYKRCLLALGIIAIIAASAIVYVSDINWVLEIRTYRYYAIFFLMLVSSISILFPLPGEALLAASPGLLNLGGSELFWLGLVASIGAALGEITSYFAGYWGRAIITDKYQKGYSKVDHWMRSYGAPAIFVFSLTPLPFDLVGIAAGTLRFPLWKFLLYCWAGRLVRSLLIIYLGWGSSSLFF